MIDDLIWADATRLSLLLRRREVNAREILETAIERIERVNPTINAVVRVEMDKAVAALDRGRDTAFNGLPLLIKDLGDVTFAGYPQYQGNRVLRDLDHRAAATSMLGERFAAAGFVPIGTTNTSEFGLQATTQPYAFGATRNPWDLERSVNGSSGGSAAAVATGMVAMAQGGDGGGSIRGPAAWCGVVGLKPSRGRMPQDGRVRRYAVPHVLTRTVRDTAAALDILHGAAADDLFRLPTHRRPFSAWVERLLGPLRIAVVTDVPVAGVDTHPEVAKAVHRAASALEQLGHEIEFRADVEICTDEFIERRRLLGAAEVSAGLGELSRLAGRSLGREDIEPFTRAYASCVEGRSALDYYEAAEWVDAFSNRLLAWQRATCDVVLTPTVASLPLPLSELEPPAEDPLKVGYRLNWISGSFTAPFNVTGQPAISIPFGVTATRLPMAVQLIAPIGREDMLISLAARLEETPECRSVQMQMRTLLDGDASLKLPRAPTA